MVRKTILLNSGYKIPIIGLGIWSVPHGVIGRIIKTALDIGYRYFDCTQAYGNEAEIGEAFEEYFKKSSNVKREDVFIGCKICINSFALCSLEIENMLNRFRLNYIDLVLIHYSQESHEDYLESWKALEKKVNEGKICSIGLSNFNVDQIQHIQVNASILPTVLEVEAHLYFEKLELRRFCHSKNIVFIASSSLSSARCSSNFRQVNDGVDCIDPFILQLSKKFDDGIKTISMLELQSTPAKVVLCWSLQNDKTIIQKSILKVNHDSYDYKIEVDSIPEINLHDLDLHILDPTVCEENCYSDLTSEFNYYTL